MKKFVLGLFLILLVSGCAGMPDIFNGLIPGTGSKVNKTELSPDLVVIKNINVIPNPPINAGDQFTVSFEIQNQDELKDATDVNYVLYDYGLCNPLYLTNPNEGDPIEGSLNSLAPLQTEFKQWRFSAPDNSQIGYLSAKCPIRFKANYTYTSTSQIDFDVISKERLEQLQRAGTPPSFTPSLSVGRGPVKIYFSFGNEMPIKSNNTLSLFLSVEDKGAGLFGKVENSTLILNFPEGISDLDCGPKFKCSPDMGMITYCQGKFLTSDPKEKVCDVNNDGIIDMRDISQLISNVTVTSCKNKEDIPLIKKISPQIRCSFRVPNVDIEKTLYISGFLGYLYDVNGETTVSIKPTLT